MAAQLDFDEPGLVARLAKLPSELRVAFAALCAERQLPNYIQFSERSGWGNPNVLKDALESIWQDIQGQSHSKAEFETLLEQCMTLIPTEDTEGDTANAEDAAASVAYTIRSRLADDPQEAAWAAQCAYNALWHLLMSQIESTSIEPEHVRFVRSHSLVQAELRRQQADLQELQLVSAETSLPGSVISGLRDRARRDAEFFLNAATAH